ncbi:MAG TPA: hypothetical protein PKC87_00425 [Candidatus Absconditabacterales bacterium]|nr:hypothetical protein [Candidatus Absconditabacterales bacterium]
MKDIIKRIIISIISGLFIGYIAYLFFQNMIIVQSAYLDYNTLYYLILVLICLFLFVLFGIYPVYFRLTKATLFVLGLVLIIIGDTVLLNDISTYVYVGDIFKVLGVVLTLLAWTNILITDKISKKKQEKNVQIIEV